MRKRTLLTGAALCAILLPLTGCLYVENRAADLRDIFQFGVGVTHESPKGGILPPSLGVYVQASELLNIGAIHYDGVTAELDGRGLFAGPESRTQIGLGPYQLLRIDQDYDNGSENYFKKEDSLWTKRMNSKKMRSRGLFPNKPAKELDYKFWANPWHEGWPIMHRGWQYWENIGVQIALSEPFVTHHGLTLKFGFDPSEIFDFLLGFAGVDFKQDDLNEKEFAEEHAETAPPEGQPPSPQAVAAPAPAPAAGPKSENLPVSAPVEGPRPNKLKPAVDMLIIYFDYDKSNIRPDQMERLEKDLKYLKDHPEVKVQIEGNCDERGTTEYNLALGERRAKTVLEYLTKNGIAADRLRVLSKGEENPADPGHTEEAWGKNRRDEFMIFE